MCVHHAVSAQVHMYTCVGQYSMATFHIPLIFLFQHHSFSHSLFAESALSAGAAAGISFIVTLIATAVATAIIVTLIIFFCFKRRGSYSSTTTTTRKTHTTTSTSVNMCNLDEKPPAFGGTSADSKPSPAKKPGRPLAPPPKPPVPTRPIPHARPYSPPTHNGY